MYIQYIGTFIACLLLISVVYQRCFLRIFNVEVYDDIIIMKHTITGDWCIAAVNRLVVSELLKV